MNGRSGGKDPIARRQEGESVVLRPSGVVGGAMLFINSERSSAVALIAGAQLPAHVSHLRWNHLTI